jgi:hypothetical protein
MDFTERLAEIDKQYQQTLHMIRLLTEQLDALRIQGHQLEGAKLLCEALLAAQEKEEPPHIE